MNTEHSPFSRYTCRENYRHLPYFLLSSFILHVYTVVVSHTFTFGLTNSIGFYLDRENEASSLLLSVPNISVQNAKDFVIFYRHTLCAEHKHIRKRITSTNCVQHARFQVYTLWSADEHKHMQNIDNSLKQNQIKVYIEHSTEYTLRTTLSRKSEVYNE